MSIGSTRIVAVLTGLVLAALAGVAGAPPASAQSADLSVTKADTPDPVVAGSDLTFTITLTNGGPSDAVVVSLSDPIPANTTFVSFAQTSGPAFTLTSPPVGGTGGTRNLTVFQVNATTGSLASGGIQPPNTLGATGSINGLAFVPLQPTAFDFDRDLKADLGVFRQSTGEWLVFGSAAGFPGPVPFGAPGLGDLPIPTDYDGDGKADLAVYRASTAEYYVFGSATGFPGPIPFGAPGLGDIPLNRPAALR